jgi:hypothetical protein
MVLEIQHSAQRKHNALKDEKTAILQGEAAANARLQSALDSLTPKHDYYEYS